MCLYVNIIKINWYIIWNKVVKLVGSMVYLNLNEIIVFKLWCNLKLVIINCYICNFIIENDYNGEDLKLRLNIIDWDFIWNGENLV